MILSVPKWLRRPFFFLFGLLFVLGSSAAPALAELNKTIITAGPSWDGFTNKDGHGLYHELMHKIFPPPFKLKHDYVSLVQANELVAAGRADIMLCDTEAAPPRLLARYPLYENAYYLVYRKALIAPWRGNKSLQGKRVVWREGYYSQRDFPVPVQPTLVRSGVAALMLMILDRVDFYVDDLALIKQSFAEASKDFDRSNYGLQKIGRRNYYPIFAATPRGRQLMNLYEKGLERLAQKNQLAPIYRRWGFSLPEKTP